MRALSCGMKSPRDCFSCKRADCDCDDLPNEEEGRWKRETRRKPIKQKEPKRVAISIKYNTTRRKVKSNVRRNNYEFLFY